MNLKEYLKKSKISNLPVKGRKEAAEMDRIIEDNIRVMNKNYSIEKAGADIDKTIDDKIRKDADGESCPECRLFTLEKQGICSTCRNCGWSKCNG
ncbi:MAG: hypothetical protein Ta2F_19110 [Termitinemataceae bacterium]|nr:MAG: hypothetical protein Ta2F_19110 [Termitinemataceae bacterium]